MADSAPAPSRPPVGHLDAAFGLSGDMVLGALLDAGARLEAVNAALAATGVPGLHAEVRRATRCGLDCARVILHCAADGAGAPADQGPADAARVDTHEAADSGGPAAVHGQEHARRHEQGHPHDDGGHGHQHPAGQGAPAHHHRPFGEIRGLLERADLAVGVRARALAVFGRLAAAEARVHGFQPGGGFRPGVDPALGDASLDAVLLHEVGAEDAIGDIVGIAAALEDLGIERLTVSALPAGGGTVRAAHGLLPVPAPAVALLLQGFDCHPGPVAAELVTPTGAAVVAALARPSPAWPAMRLVASGWGAGARDFTGHPNACRLVWGHEATPGEGLVPGDPHPDGLCSDGLQVERLYEIETHLDDQSPEQVGHLYELLFSLGALDVATGPLWMKKQRPGHRLWVLVRPCDLDAATRCLFRESTAIGLRVREVTRLSLPRESATVATAFGDLRVKVARRGGVVVNAAPEFDDCREAARVHGVPLKAVMAAVVAAWAAHPAGAG